MKPILLLFTYLRCLCRTNSILTLTKKITYLRLKKLNLLYILYVSLSSPVSLTPVDRERERESLSTYLSHTDTL